MIDKKCPDGSWNKLQSRRCKLKMAHTGPHKYEIIKYDSRH